jgi:RNA polymerase Rpb1, domain 2
MYSVSANTSVADAHTVINARQADEEALHTAHRTIPVRIRRYAGLGCDNTSILPIRSVGCQSMRVPEWPMLRLCNEVECIRQKCTKGCRGHIGRIVVTNDEMGLERTTNRVCIHPVFLQGESYRENLLLSRVYNSMRSNNFNDVRDAALDELSGKEGIFRRETLGGRIDGSLRSVIVPYYAGDGGTIMVPRTLAERVAVPVLGDGVVREGRLKEFTYAIVIRPPTMTSLSCQPMRMEVWDRPCLGFPVQRCKDYNADFDGDEVHVYPMTTRAAELECSQWEFQRSVVQSVLDEEREKGICAPGTFQTSSIVLMHDSSEEAQQAVDNWVDTAVTMAVGYKGHCVKSYWLTEAAEDDGYMGEERIVKPAIFNSWYDGMKSIMAVQHSQGPIGRASITSRHMVSMVKSVQTLNVRTGLGDSDDDGENQTSVDGVYPLAVSPHAVAALANPSLVTLISPTVTEICKDSPGVALMSRICSSLQQKALDQSKPGMLQMTRVNTADCIVGMEGSVAGLLSLDMTDPIEIQHVTAVMVDCAIQFADEYEDLVPAIVNTVDTADWWRDPTDVSVTAVNPSEEYSTGGGTKDLDAFRMLVACIDHAGITPEPQAVNEVLHAMRVANDDVRLRRPRSSKSRICNGGGNQMCSWMIQRFVSNTAPTPEVPNTLVACMHSMALSGNFTF